MITGKIGSERKRQGEQMEKDAHNSGDVSLKQKGQCIQRMMGKPNHKNGGPLRNGRQNEVAVLVAAENHHVEIF